MLRFYSYFLTKLSFPDLFRMAKAKFKDINIVVNNAGILNERTWEKTIDVNLVRFILHLLSHQHLHFQVLFFICSSFIPSAKLVILRCFYVLRAHRAALVRLPTAPALPSTHTHTRTHKCTHAYTCMHAVTVLELERPPEYLLICIKGAGRITDKYSKICEYVDGCYLVNTFSVDPSLHTTSTLLTR